MKKQFLSLSLLLSTVAFAAYDVKMTIAVGDNHNDYEWTSDEVLVAENNAGVIIESRVMNVNDESAVINVTITKRSGEQLELLQSSDVTAQLDQEASIACPAEGVDASISFLVTKQVEVAQDTAVTEENNTQATEENVA